MGQNNTSEAKLRREAIFAYLETGHEVFSYATSADATRQNPDSETDL
jgi:hypothetical protein